MSPQERKQQKLVAIYQALLQLMSQKPMADIGITELCQQADVSRTYFYRNYGNFEQIILMYQEQLMLKYLRRLPLTAKSEMSDLMTRYFEVIKHDADTNRLLIQNGQVMIVFQTFQSVFQILMQHDRISHPARNTIINEPYYAEYLSGAVVNVAITWLNKGMIESPQYLGKLIERLSKTQPAMMPTPE